MGKLFILFLAVAVFSLFSYSQDAFGGAVGRDPILVTINDVSILEGNPGDTTIFTFDVDVTELFCCDEITISYETSDAGGTATEDDDYVGESGSITILGGNPGGVGSGTITIEINEDTDFEGDETFSVVLTGCTFPVGVSCDFTKNTGVGTILNDDEEVEPLCDPGLVFDPEAEECIVAGDTAYVSGANSSGDDLDSGAIGIVDFDSGDITQVGDQVVEGGLSGLTFDSNGNLFASSVFGGSSQSELYQIDPITGDATLIGDIEIPAVVEGTPGELKIRDLATQPGTDVIFGLGQVVEGDSFGCDSFSPGNSLFTIDPSDASADCIGIFDISEGKVGGIAFAPDGTLYAVGGGGCFNDDDDDCTNFLASFNPDDASFAGFVLFDVEDFLDGLGIRSSDGAFFGTIAQTGDSVHSIDLATGDTPAVAGVGEFPSDITFFPSSEPELIVPSTSGGDTISGDPTLGVQRNGILVQSDGFCFDLFCLDVFDYFNHLPIQQVNSGSTHTISLTAFCPSGSNRCNYASVGAAPPGTDINFVDWNLVLKRIGLTDNWELIENDPNNMLGDVVGTVQVIDASRIQYSFSVQFSTPASIGTVDGNALPPEDNMILVTEIRDSNGGSNRNIFNDGVFVNDIYAYPQIDESYMPPLEVESLCLNEDSTKRYTCAFDKVRQWTIKQAEQQLQEIYNNHRNQLD